MRLDTLTGTEKKKKKKKKREWYWKMVCRVPRLTGMSCCSKARARFTLSSGM